MKAWNAIGTAAEVLGEWMFYELEQFKDEWEQAEAIVLIYVGSAALATVIGCTLKIIKLSTGWW